MPNVNRNSPLVDHSHTSDDVESVNQPYDGRNLSYSTTFTNPWKVLLIKTMEWTTGKIRLLRLVRKFERQGVPKGQAFWDDTLGLMGIDLLTPEEQIARIPKTGPVVVAANHPHGLVDGMVLAGLVGKVRQDYKILTRNLLTGVEEIEQHMVPVAFPHEPDAIRKNIEMRNIAMTHLKAGGVVILFPSGSVATSKTFFGRAEEADWNPFTAKMVLRSDAKVLPIFFPGQNSRWFQIANKLSETLRQGMLLHEVVFSLDKPQSPVVGEIIEREEIEKWSSNPRGFMAWLREKTLSLKNQ